MRNGMLDEAEKELQEALAAEPSVAQFHMLLSHLRSRQGRLEDAIAYARRANELAPA